MSSDSAIKRKKKNKGISRSKCHRITVYVLDDFASEKRLTSVSLDFSYLAACKVLGISASEVFNTYLAENYLDSEQFKNSSVAKVLQSVLLREILKKSGISIENYDSELLSLESKAILNSEASCLSTF